MRVARIALSFALILPGPLPAASSLHRTPQQTTATSPSATITLQQSLAALAPNLALNDVTLSGSVHRSVGSDDQSGSAILKALSSGAARADLSFSSGTISEIYNSSSSELTGAWSSPDGTLHAIPFHNLLSEPAWFFPTFAISRRLSTGYVVTDLGSASFSDQQVEHISTLQSAALKSSARQASFQHLSQVDFYLDSASLLPVAISFNTHPDNDASLDIPVEIRFSDYRAVSGVQIPFHIQKIVNGSLFLEIQIQNATTNSGLSAASFSSL
jgi:hypothetical protein